MSKLRARFIGRLALLGIRDSETARAVTDGEQSFSGTKTLSGGARSPNSGDDLDSMPAAEVLTHKGMQAQVDELMRPPKEVVLVEVPEEDAPGGGGSGGSGGAGGVGESTGGSSSTGGGANGTGWMQVFPPVASPAAGEYPLDYTYGGRTRRATITVPKGAQASALPGHWPAGTTLTGGGDDERDRKPFVELVGSGVLIWKPVRC